MSARTILSKETNGFDDKSKSPYFITPNMRGVTDWGDLLQFAPYESGYCFLVVLGVPCFSKKGPYNKGFKKLQKLFVSILENEFTGLSGIEDWSTETYNIGAGNSTQTIISKTKGMGDVNISMTFNEKTGTPITKYLAEYLKRVRNPYSTITSYNLAVKYSTSQNDNVDYIPSPYRINHHRETFTFLYIVTDSTCLNVEKAFALLNCKPQSAGYADLYNVTKGDISSRQAQVNFTCSVREGNKVNLVAQEYLYTLINTCDNDGPIIINSYDYDWSISFDGGTETRIGDLGIANYYEGARDKNIYQFTFSDEKANTYTNNGSNGLYTGKMRTFFPDDEYEGLHYNEEEIIKSVSSS